MQSAEYMSRQLGIPLERVQRVVDGLDRLGIVWRVSASIGDEPTIIYGYGHSAALVCMLTLAKTLVAVREKPRSLHRHMEPGHIPHGGISGVRPRPDYILLGRTTCR